MRQITYAHLRRHDISLSDYKIKYGGPTRSESTLDRRKKMRTSKGVKKRLSDEQRSKLAESIRKNCHPVVGESNKRRIGTLRKPKTDPVVMVDPWEDPRPTFNKCTECGYECKSSLALTWHLKCAHSMSTEEYYLKNNDYNGCEYCGNDVKFVSTVIGYRRFCSQVCKGKSMWEDPNSICNSPEARKAFSELISSKWKDPNHAFNSPEFREKLATRPQYNSFPGFVQGYYKGTYFASSYELKYLRYADLAGLEVARATPKYICEYIHDGNIRRYHPDFYVNGEVIEVKGWVTPVTRLKESAFLSKYPEVPYKLLMIEDIHNLLDSVGESYDHTSYSDTEVLNESQKDHS